jgi:hypothetical protein
MPVLQHYNSLHCDLVFRDFPALRDGHYFRVSSLFSAGLQRPSPFLDRLPSRLGRHSYWCPSFRMGFHLGCYLFYHGYKTFEIHHNYPSLVFKNKIRVQKG